MEIQKLIAKRHEQVEILKYFGKGQLQFEITFLKIFWEIKFACFFAVKVFHLPTFCKTLDISLAYVTLFL
jgi:hypothetical protein